MKILSRKLFFSFSCLSLVYLQAHSSPCKIESLKEILEKSHNDNEKEKENLTKQVDNLTKQVELLEKLHDVNEKEKENLAKQVKLLEKINHNHQNIEPNDKKMIIALLFTNIFSIGFIVKLLFFNNDNHED